MFKSMFAPKQELSEADLKRGLRYLTIEGVASMGFGSITGSGFLVAFALALGANNLEIGLLAALPFLAMPLQLVTVGLIEKYRRRKVFAVVIWAGVQALWLPIGLIPVFVGVPSGGAVTVLLLLIASRSALAALQNTAWTSWMREIVPRAVMGVFFARRLSYANVAAMVFGLGAAFFVDYWRSQTGTAQGEALGYTYAILAGAIFLGMSSVFARALMPEPAMPAHEGPQQPLRTVLAEPLKDPNYKHLLRFQFLWGFALNLAVPFFAVYMLTRLGLPISAVMAFSVLMQASNVVFLRMWGPMLDRVGSKTVLALGASLYLLVVLGWTFTTLPERYFLTIPLLVVLHILAGAASAANNLASGTISIKLAPAGKATAYMAASSLAINLGSGIGPILGGRFIDFFSVRSLALDFTWIDPGGISRLPALNLTSYDFLFGITFIIGLLTLNVLNAVRETGEVSREKVLESMMAPMRQASGLVGAVPGLASVAAFPFGLARLVPGLDVAVGVTAYEIAHASRAAASAATRGLQTGSRVASSVQDRVQSVVSDLRHASASSTAAGREVAASAARGAIHGVREARRRSARARPAGGTWRPRWDRTTERA